MARYTHEHYFFNCLKLICELALTPKDKYVLQDARLAACRALLHNDSNLCQHAELGNQRTNKEHGLLRRDE